MDKHIKYILILFFIFTGCFSLSCYHTTDNTTITRTDSTNPMHIKIDDIKNIKNLKDVVKDFIFIPLETTDSSIISKIDKVLYLNKKFYVFDKKFQNLLIFDQAGKFLNSVGHIGNGPGEYKELTNFTIDDKTNHILLLDNGKMEIKEYDENGNFIKSKRSNIFGESFYLLNSKYYFYIGQNISSLSRNFHLIIMNMKGKIIQRIFPFPINFNYGIPSGFLIQNAKGLLYNSSFNDTLFQITINNQISPKYIFNFGSNKLPKDIQNSLHKFMKNSLNYSYLGNKAIESDSILMFYYFNKGTYKFAFCSKNIKVLKADGKIYLTPKLLQFPIHKPLGITDNNYFITSISVPSLMLSVNHRNSIFSKEIIKKRYPELFKLLPRLHDFSNPILLLFKFK